MWTLNVNASSDYHPPLSGIPNEMKKSTKEIEKWIYPFVSIVGEEIEVDAELKNLNIAKYFIRKTIPEQFEKYAIILHSYWINYSINEKDVKESENEDPEYPEEEYSRTSWTEFYNLKQIEFNLNKAIHSTLNLNRELTQLNNELYPGEGLMDKEHLEEIKNKILELYGNEEIEVFHNFLSTSSWEKSIMFEMKISDLMKLLKNKELRFTPSLIYPKNKKWMVNTDFDLPFTTIGGEGILIDKLVQDNPLEIFEIEY